MNYYIVCFIYKLSPYYCIWSTDVEDLFLVENGKIITFNDIELLLDYCKSKKYEINITDVSEYDLDNLKKWCSCESSVINCNEILNFWNIFDDVLNSLKISFVGNDEKFNSVYDKIFYGNNLSSINTSGKKYKPKFEDSEISLIKDVMLHGINVLVNAL